MENKMGATKNKQDIAVIRKMTEKYFGDNHLIEATELLEGMCNVAYRLTLEDGTRVILKIAPQFQDNLMANEINMMDAEVKAMQLVKENTSIPVAKVYCYNTSCTICSNPYFMMEMLEGESYFSCKEKLDEDEIQKLDYEIGQIEIEIAQIKGTRFGLLGDLEHQTDSLYDYFYIMMSRVCEDATKKSVDLSVNGAEILKLLELSKECFFAEKFAPCLVHWDMWEGNIFIGDGHIKGIIDWERAIWAEPFLDDRFRRHTRTQAFLQGFGQTDFSREETIRILWYDCFLYLTMMVEGTYREYEDDSQYQWVKPLFRDSYEELISYLN